MPKVKVNNFNMYYEVHGDGFPLIMIGGLGGNIYWWDTILIDELSKNLKTVAIDNRGVGRSDDPDEDFLIKTMADDMVGLMNALEIERAHVLGISMGGSIAQEIVINYPEMVEKLVLCACSCGGSKSVPPSIEVLNLLMSFVGRKHDLKLVKEVLPLMFTEDFMKKNPDYIEDKIEMILKTPTTASTYKRQLEAGMKSPTRCRKLKKVDTQTLVIHGKKDILNPTQNGEILTNLIPNAKLALFDNNAHWVFYPEPEKVIETILAFLK